MDQQRLEAASQLDQQARQFEQKLVKLQTSTRPERKLLIDEHLKEVRALQNELRKLKVQHDKLKNSVAAAVTPATTSTASQTVSRQYVSSSTQTTLDSQALDVLEVRNSPHRVSSGAYERPGYHRQLARPS